MATRHAGQGTLSSQIRHYNQRLILQRLRRLGEASKADLARAASLTNTAVGEIVRDLEARGLIRTIGKKHAGARGQPATMLQLDPDGAYAIGVRLDRSRIETVLTDLAGTILCHRTHDLELPPPAHTLEIVRSDVAALAGSIPVAQRRRITGIGLARPWNLANWLTELDLRRDVFVPWDSFEFASALGRASALPVFEENDGTAAAVAELFHGSGRRMDDFLYVFIGPAIGGGIVLGGNCLRGASNNAADVGVMPVGPSHLSSAPPLSDSQRILLGRASVNALIRHLRHRGNGVAGLGDLRAAIKADTTAMTEWLADCVDALVQPLLAARALLDVSTVIIDSDLDSIWIDALIARAGVALSAASAEARPPPRLLRGSFGAVAGALGAATLPLFIHFGPGTNTIPGGGSYALVA
jgi:predicted NBD/HSP70 family sugar kinase